MTKKVRRTFTDAWKKAFVKRANNAKPGQQAKLLRENGLFASHLRAWRIEYDMFPESA